MQVRLLVGVLKAVGTGDLKVPDGGVHQIIIIIFKFFVF